MLRSHMEKCDAARAQLDEWYEHRTKVEAELSKLAWQFDNWGLDSRMESLALQSVESRGAPAGAIVGVCDGPGVANGQVPGEATATQSKKAGVAVNEDIKRRMDIVLGLIEHDRILTDKLFKSIIALQTNETVLAFKIQCVFGGGCDFMSAGLGTSGNMMDDMIRLAQKIKLPIIMDIVSALTFDLPWDLAGVVKGIKDLAVEDFRTHSEAAIHFHIYVNCAKKQREGVRSLMLEYLAN
ncbi:unnamed protein product [Cylicocyclus nassatus]|uniref:Uncharacterized protein n=1 Tax=Cylicocyclus nassatus TaxID=53992 RepID=A0AA36M6R0_CYLNA|nr:unnamed protein product [Cylicocyclus nassatus]